MFRVFPFAMGVALAMAAASTCAADSLRDNPASVIGILPEQTLPPSQLSRIRGSGISAPVLLEPAARIRLWDELQRRAGGTTPSQPSFNMGTLTITSGPTR